MIEDYRSIKIKSTQIKVFEVIETMPNKFPTYKILDAKPFLFFRLAFVDGFRPALKIMFDKELWEEIKKNTSLILKKGELLGPFALTDLQKPITYMFTLSSFFFNCKTGYTIKADKNETLLSFDLVAESPGLIEKIWWFFVKPVHVFLAYKVLKVVKQKIEGNN